MNQKIDDFKTVNESINNILPIIKSLLESYNEQHPNEIQIIVSHNLLQRLYYGIKTISWLLQPFLNDTNFKYPIGLQVRTSLLDTLTIAYLTSSLSNDDEFKLKVAKISLISVKNNLKDITAAYNNKHLNKEEYNNSLKNIKELYSVNFKENSNDLDKKIEFIKPNEIAEELKKTNMIFFSDAYNLYKYYSQYEHYSFISKTMLDSPPEFEFDQLKKSLFFILHGIRICCLNLLIQNQDLSIIDDIINRFGEMKELFRG